MSTLFFFAKSIWIYYLFRLITFNPLFFRKITITIYYLLRNFSLNSLSFSQIHLESTYFRRIIINSISASRFHFEFTIFFPEVTMKTRFFAKSIWIHYQLREFTSNPFFTGKLLLICCLLRHFSFNSLSFFAELLWIRYEITMKPLWNHYETGITMNSLWNQYEITMKLILWLIYLLRDDYVMIT